MYGQEQRNESTQIAFHCSKYELSKFNLTPSYLTGFTSDHIKKSGISLVYRFVF